MYSLVPDSAPNRVLFKRRGSVLKLEWVRVTGNPSLRVVSGTPGSSRKGLVKAIKSLMKQASSDGVPMCVKLKNDATQSLESRISLWRSHGFDTVHKKTKDSIILLNTIA